MPEISIIVPVYNVEQYLNRCIDSILAQSFTNFELILVDDGSPDNCGAICDEYTEKDSRVKVIHKANAGVSAARNSGIDLSCGKYIMFCDSDDYVDVDWCAKMRNLFIEYPDSDLGFCGYNFVDSSSGRITEKVVYSNTESISYKTTEFFELYMANMMNMPWNKIYKSEIIKKNDLRFDSKISYNEDLLFVLKYIQHMSGCFSVCNLPLNYYLKGIEGSLTNRYINNLWNIKKSIFAEFEVTAKKCDVDLMSDENRERYYNKWIWSVVYSLNNNMLKKNKINFFKKYKENSKILKSSECNLAFKYGNFDAYHPLYAKLLKTRCYLFVFLFEKAINIKNKI